MQESATRTESYYLCWCCICYETDYKQLWLLMCCFWALSFYSTPCFLFECEKIENNFFDLISASLKICVWCVSALTRILHRLLGAFFSLLTAYSLPLWRCCRWFSYCCHTYTKTRCDAFLLKYLHVVHAFLPSPKRIKIYNCLFSPLFLFGLCDWVFTQHNVN